MPKHAESLSTGSKSDRVLLIVLTVLLIGVSLAVTVQMLKPGARRANLDAVVQDCLGIIAASQKWHHSSKVMGGAERGGWSGIRFDKIGYSDNLGPDGMSMTNENARYVLRTAADGMSFDLIAEGRQGVLIVYRNLTDAPPPNPEIR